MKKQRLDEVLIQRELITDRATAFIIVTEGRVFVGGQKAISPAQLVSSDAAIEVRGGREYVGRGAYKLEAALEKFRIDISGKVCADIGAATGGFTEVLLGHGAKKVYAIDTARGKFDLKLRSDPRVILMEETDVRDVAQLPELADIIAIDVSLISLRNILSSATRFLSAQGVIVALFKPQYETRDQKVLKHGVVQDDAIREKLLKEFRAWAEENRWLIRDMTKSPIRGASGNVEYLLLFQKSL